jgi:hypothetical protein
MELNKIKYFFKINKWLLIIFIFHFLLVNHFFPVIEVFNDKPIVTDDYPYKFYLSSVQKISLENFAFIGIDFNFSEGFNNFIYNWDKVSVLFFFLIFFLPEIFVFKCYIYLLFLFAPFLIYFSSINFKFNIKVSILSFFICSIIINFHYYIHLYLFVGIYSYIFGCLYLLLALSYIYKFVYEKKRKNIFFVIILILVSLCLHPLLILFFLIPICYLIFNLLKKNHIKRLYIYLFTIVFLSFSFLLLFSKTTLFYLNSENSFFQPSLGLFALFFELFYRPIQTLLFTTGFLGIFICIKNKFKKNFFLFVSIYFLFFTYFGSYLLFIENFKTYRMIVCLSFFLIFPSSHFLLYLFKNFKNFNSFFKFFIILFLIFILIFSLFSFNKKPNIDEKYYKMDQNIREKLRVNIDNTKYNVGNSIKSTWNLKMTTKIPKDVELLINWINLNTDNTGRILIEDSGYETNHMYGGHTVSLLPQFTNRQYFAKPGTYVLGDSEIKISSFWNHKILGENLNLFNETEIINLVDNYNIKWIIVFSDESKSYLSKYQNLFIKMNEFGKFKIFNVNYNSNFFIEGSGIVKVNVSTLNVYNASKGRIILKYPYIKGCVSEPNQKISSIDKFNYYEGFILIEDNLYDNFSITCIRKIF